MIKSLSVLLLVFMLCACGQSDELSEPLEKSYAEFLSLMRNDNNENAAKSGFNPKLAPNWDLSQLQAYIPENGIFFTDANERFVAQVGKREILDALSARKGEVFMAFAHFSYIYSTHARSTRVLDNDPVAGQQVLLIPGWYRLMFQVGNQTPLLIRFDYIKTEVD